MSRKGGCYDLDDLCDTGDTLGIGVGKQLYNGRVHSYTARLSNHSAGTGPLSEAITLWARWAKKARRSKEV